MAKLAGNFQGKYIIGYCRPPAYTQFRRGQSGNPSGKPAGSISLAKALQREVRKKNNIAEIVERVYVRALKGDIDCLRLIFDALDCGQIKRRQGK